jgi:pantoate--beta-alanine ligase
LYRALRHAQQCVYEGERHVRILEKAVGAILSSEPNVRVNYIAFCDTETLEPVVHVSGKVVVLLAARVGSVRLIDNIILKIS